MAKKKQILYPVVFMVLITLFFTFILALLNEVTIDTINEKQELKVKKTILYVFNIDVSEDAQEINQKYNEYIKITKINDRTIYKASKEGKNLGYAFEMLGPGLWGSINGFVAVDSEFTKILGIDFVTHSETPGLGGRIDEDWFKDQFRGIDINASEIVIYKPANNGNADAITGATLTSESVRKIINQEVVEFINVVRGDINE